VLPSLSRLKDKGIGKGKTREDHSGLLNELFAAYARGRDAKELAIVLGESALTETDRTFVKMSDEFERRFVRQGRDENRSIEQTLSIGWKLLSMLPLQELKRVSPALIEKYMPKAMA
jgi:V/A-type H+-transporting ATPase subunit B